MKKIFTFFMFFIVSLTLVACGGETVEYIAPTITGVIAEKEMFVNDSLDVLTGVEGFEEEKDVTSNIVVTTNPHLEIVDGVITPTEVGNYIIVYTLIHSKDSNLVTTKELLLEVVYRVVVNEDIDLDIDFKFVEYDFQGFYSNNDNLSVVGEDLVIAVDEQTKVSKKLNVDPNISHYLDFKFRSDGEVLLDIHLLDTNNQIMTYFGNFSYNQLFNYGISIEPTGLEEVIIQFTFHGYTTVQITEFDVKALDVLEESIIDHRYLNHRSLNEETEVEQSETDVLVNVLGDNVNIFDEGLFYSSIYMLANVNYTLSFTINTNKAFNFEFNGFKGYDYNEPFFTNELIIDQLNEDVLFEIEFVGDNYEGSSLEFEFLFGTALNGTKFTLSNIQLVGRHAHNYVSDYTRFNGNFGFEVLYFDDLLEGTLIHDKDNEEIVYQINNFNVEYLINQLDYDNYFVKEGSKYVFEISMKSSKNLEVDYIIFDKYSINVIKEKTITLTNEYQVFTIETDIEMSFDQMIQIILNFDDNDFENATVYINSFVVKRIYETLE